MTGIPSAKDLQEIQSPLSLSVFDKLSSEATRKSLDQLIPGAPPDAIDLIGQCLQFRPSKRLTAE